MHHYTAVNKNMAGIVKNLEHSLNNLNLEQVSSNMDQFERQFENLDVQTEFVEQAMSNTTAATTPAEEVSKLMQEVADEHGLEFAAARMRLRDRGTKVCVASKQSTTGAPPS